MSKKDFKKTKQGRGYKPKDKRTNCHEETKLNDFKQGPTLTGSNDEAWYSLNKNLLAMSSRLPFGRPIGNNVAIQTETCDGTGTRTPYTTQGPVPGIMTFYMLSSVGCSDAGNQSIDVAAKSIYSWVRHANSGHTNYDSPDLMIYLLACRDVYALAGYMLKIYSCVNKYDPTNRYYPRAVLSALGIGDWIFTEISDFRYYCAQWFKKASVLYTPKDLPLFNKAFWMYTQIFEEDKTGKSGLYQYAPAGFYQFNPTKYSTGGCLEYKSLPTFNSLNDFMTYCDGILNVLINDEDMGIMSGDIKKAFNDKTWTLGEFPYDAVITPVKDSFVLQQMHNITPINVKGGSTLDIVQDNTVNEILYFPRIELGPNTYTLRNLKGTNVILDIDSEVPSEGECMEASQYVSTLTHNSDVLVAGRIAKFNTIVSATLNNYSFVVTEASDYICCMVRLHLVVNGSPLSAHDYAIGSLRIPSTYSHQNIVNMLSAYSTFTWSPMIMWDNTTFPFFGSLHNYTLVNTEVLANMHDCAWLSLLAIPASEHIK